MKYQIFISYRRSTGENLAQLLYYRFSSDGYKVFFDVETMRSGKFNQQIYAKIDECDDFVLVLSDNALNRCEDEKDWVRLEIEYALQKGKNIIPVLARNFTFPDDLPESIQEIRFYQAVTANSEFFDSVIDRLEHMFVSKLQSMGDERNTDISKFVDILERLYESTVSYRAALRNGVQDDYNVAMSNMVSLLQKLYNICEKDKYICSEKYIIKKCLEIVDQFNRFVLYFNAFANSSNRMSTEAQEYARCAENEFMRFVDKICEAMGKR